MEEQRKRIIKMFAEPTMEMFDAASPETKRALFEDVYIAVYTFMLQYFSEEGKEVYLEIRELLLDSPEGEMYNVWLNFWWERNPAFSNIVVWNCFTRFVEIQAIAQQEKDKLNDMHFNMN